MGVSQGDDSTSQISSKGRVINVEFGVPWQHKENRVTRIVELSIMRCIMIVVRRLHCGKFPEIRFYFAS